MNITRAELILQEKLDEIEHISDDTSKEEAKEELWESIQASIAADNRKHHKKVLRRVACLLILVLLLPATVLGAKKFFLFNGLISSDVYHVGEKYGSTEKGTNVLGDYNVRIEQAITSKDNSEGTLYVSFVPTSKKAPSIHNLLNGSRATDGTCQDIGISAVYKDKKGKEHKIDVPSLSYSYEPELAKDGKDYVVIRYSFNDSGVKTSFHKRSRVYLTLMHTITKSVSIDTDGDSKQDDSYDTQIRKEHGRLYLAKGNGYPVYEVKSGDNLLRVSPISIELIGSIPASIAEKESNYQIYLDDGTTTSLNKLGVCGTSTTSMDGASQKSEHSYEISDIIDVTKIDHITVGDTNFDFQRKKNITNK